MPLYDYECIEHGIFEVFQHMTDRHTANCPKCNSRGRRVFQASMLSGDLPSKDKRMGKTREELFQNLGKEGQADPDMWKYDAHQQDESFNRDY